MDWTKINLSNLPFLPLNKKKELPALEAIYFCVIGEEILYIGQSKNVNQRWRNHHRYCELAKKGGVEIYWFECTGLKQRLTAEQSLIEHYKPSLNLAPIRLKIVLDNVQGLNEQKFVYLLPQKQQSIKSHCKLFDEMLNRFNLSARNIAKLVNISEVTLSRFRKGKTDLMTTKFLAVLAAVPEEAKNWYVAQLLGAKPNINLRSRSCIGNARRKSRNSRGRLPTGFY